MESRHILLSILAGLIAFPLFATVAQAATIDIIQTFDYPGPNIIATLPQKISDQTDLVGTMIAADGTERAFIYKPLAHSFSPLLSPPFAQHQPTQGRGIEFRRHVVGEYLNGSDGTFHGFLMTHPSCTPTPTPTPAATSGASATAPAGDLRSGDEPAGGRPPCPLVYTPFDLVGASDTIPLGINNLGDIVGTAIFSDGTQQAFISIKQVVTKFVVPGASATFAYQANDSKQIIGYYIDANGMTHGYTRDSVGVLTYPIDVSGATGTLLLGNNASNWGVGRYTDTAGLTHGLFYVTPDNIVSYDYPGAAYTSLNGINKSGVVCGFYIDTAGISHGFVGMVNLTSRGERNTNLQMAPVKPAYALPESRGIAVPAL